jgi:hypothetical protein
MSRVHCSPPDCNSRFSCVILRTYIFVLCLFPLNSEICSGLKVSISLEIQNVLDLFGKYFAFK